jgi:TrmH family RNA methyltransferase
MQDNLTNSDSKLIKSLQQKKYRDAEGLFVVEGVKLVAEALAHPDLVQRVVYTGGPDSYDYSLPANAARVSNSDLERISSLKTPNKILAVCRKIEIPATPLLNQTVFALDGVSDPGNLGTIIRLCDWFGFGQLICSADTADVYNPKVVQSSMGSIFRVKCFYLDLPEFLRHLPKGQAILGADMAGTSVYQSDFADDTLVVMGSEAHGLRPEVRSCLTGYVSIPRFGNGESLNVAISAAIIASEIRRRSVP